MPGADHPRPEMGLDTSRLPQDLTFALEQQGLRTLPPRESRLVLPRYSSQLIAITGGSTGDEGKGRVILDVAKDVEASSPEDSLLGPVIKINGGANSGHTANGLKLNLLPSGVAHPQALVAISAGVVADPTKLDWEVRTLEGVQNISVLSRLTVDRRTQVSDLSHRLLDLADEWYRVNRLGLPPRGSTGRGITQAFQEETGHTQIFYGAFLRGKQDFASLMERRLDAAVRYLERYVELPTNEWRQLFETLSRVEARANKEALEAGVLTAEEVDFERFRGQVDFTLDKDLIIDTLWAAAQRHESTIGNVSQMVRQALAEGKYILCEFGQAYWLHVRHGYTPNVTSSRTWVPEIYDALEIASQPVHSLGVAKAYDTKVGTHVFVSQMDLSHPLSLKLRGIEKGVTTNRQRMVGWYDAVEKGHTLAHGGLTSLAINKLDQLTYEGPWNGKLQICTGYKLPDGKVTYKMPDTEAERRTVRPHYELYDGWNQDISKVRRFADLPEAAKQYVAGMYYHTIYAASAELGMPERIPHVHFIGVGPDPSQLIEDVPGPEVLIRMALARYESAR